MTTQSGMWGEGEASYSMSLRNASEYWHQLKGEKLLNEFVTKALPVHAVTSLSTRPTQAAHYQSGMTSSAVQTCIV